jgi:RTX calcium-binding nonapeptide repeat (4 copies)
MDQTFGSGGSISLTDSNGSALSLDTVLADGSLILRGMNSVTGSTYLIHESAKGVVDVAFGSGGSLSGSVESVLANKSLIISKSDTATGGMDLSHYSSSGLADTSYGDPTSSVVITQVGYNLSKQAPGVANMKYTGSAGVSLGGTALIGSIFGGRGNDTITAFNGETVSGGGGNDLFILNGSNVTVNGNIGGHDTLQSVVSYDLHNALGINNLLYTGSLTASLTGNGQTVFISAGSGIGNVTLNDGITSTGGGKIAPTLVGGGGVNTYIVNSSEDVIVDSNHKGILMTGNDAVLASPMASGFNNLIYTGTGSISLNGNSSSNLIVDNDQASSDSKTLVGGLGSDTLVAGPGNDILFGASPSLNFGNLGSPSGMMFGSIQGVLGGKFQLQGVDLNGDTVLAQFTTAGIPDTNFGSNGILSMDAASSLIGLGDGSYLSQGFAGGVKPFYVHYTSSGLVDTGVGSRGVLTIPSGNTLSDSSSFISFTDGSFMIGCSDGSGKSLEAHYQAGGKFDSVYVVPGNGSGTLLGDGSWLVQGSDSLNNHLFFHYLSNGQLDTLLAKNGQISIPSNSSSQNYSQLSVNETFANGGFLIQGIDSKGKIQDLDYLAGGKFNGIYQDTLATGATYLSDGSFLVEGAGKSSYAHYLSNGVLDTQIGASIQGKNTVPGNGVLSVPAGVTLGGFAGLMGSDSMPSPTLADGSYLFAGTDSAGSNVLVHYTSALALDTKFGTGGSFGLPDGITSDQVTVLTDGSVVISGMDTVTGLSSYTHYLSSGAQDLTFGSDTAGDSLVGGSGNSTLVSGPGVSTLVGGPGNTTFYVNNSSDVLKQSSLGSATIITSTGVNAGSLAGALSSVTYTGMAGAAFTLPASGTSLVAGPGNDTITGGKGNDTMDAFGSLTGGITTTQRDTMTGGGGADLFILGDSSGAYYLDGNASHGSVSYAFIPDFNLSDTLQLAASDQSGYSLIAASADSAITKALGSAVKSTDYLLEDLTGGTPDLIAVLRSTSHLTSGILNSNATYV